MIIFVWPMILTAHFCCNMPFGGKSNPFKSQFFQLSFSNGMSCCCQFYGFPFFQETLWPPPREQGTPQFTFGGINFWWVLDSMIQLEQKKHQSRLSQEYPSLCCFGCLLLLVFWPTNILVWSLACFLRKRKNCSVQKMMVQHGVQTCFSSTFQLTTFKLTIQA